MYTVRFTNARVHDDGFGLEVNGRSLEDIISTLLGTKVGEKCALMSNLPEFKSNCCNVTIIIDPQPCTVQIEEDDYFYESVEELEAYRREQFAKNEKTDTEEYRHIYLQKISS